MKIYLSGPIAGYPTFKEVFKSAVVHLSYMGHDVVNPCDILPYPHTGECPPGYSTANGHSSACYLRTDLEALLMCDAVFMLSGWERSIGARLEHSVAAHCGLMIYASHNQPPIGRRESFDG
jgi:hypothetical protein